MQCPEVPSGDSFLSATLANIDCQALTIGSSGYGALSDPASVISLALTGLLTILVALFGIRLMLGRSMAYGDALGLVLRIAIVLTLAGSWPALRTLGFDVIMDGPTEIADEIASGSGLATRSTLRERLQIADDNLVTMTAYGTGRLPGVDQRAEFRGAAMADESGFGWGRLLYLAATIAPYAALRLSAGILLALAPLFCLFLLFEQTASIFIGWLKALLFLAVGALVLALLQALHLVMLEPWIAHVIERRLAGEFTPFSATELTALGAVQLIELGLAIALLFRIAFSASKFHTLMQIPLLGSISGRTSDQVVARITAEAPVRERSKMMMSSFETTMRLQNIAGLTGSMAAQSANGSTGFSGQRSVGGATQSAPRRSHFRTSVAAGRREGQ